MLTKHSYFLSCLR